ncbi:MAG: polysaccharide biosynthesis protein [Flavobacteriales bacterium]|nr:polysaccharide biosynthesis protein [Flavobacteriales bacterium]
MNPLKKLAGHTVIYGLSSVVGRLLNYLLVPLYTRFFIPSDYGVVTEIYAYVAFLIILLTYGFETAFFNFSKKEENKNNVYTTALISLSISSVFFIGISLFYAQEISDWMGYGIKAKYIQWFAIIIGLDAVSSISFARLREEEKAIKFASIKLINILVNIGLNLYFIVVRGLGIEYIFVANLISSIITILLFTPEMLMSKLYFDKVLWRKMIAYSLPLLIAGLAGMINETIDRILLKKLLDNTQNVASEIGLYGAFYKLSIIMLLFIQTFRFAAEPFFFSHHKEKDDRKVYADVMKYFTIVTIIIFLSVTIFYDFVIGFLGKSYHDERGFVVVSILLLANLFLGVYYNLSIWYKLTEKTKFGAYISIFGAIITLSLNFILIPKIGFIGSAIATLVCYFSMTIVSYFIGKKYFPIPYQIIRISVYLSIMLAIYFIIYFSDLNTWLNSLFLIGFIIFAYILEKPKPIQKL